MPALASQPARIVCVCVFFEQRTRRRSPLLVVAHYQVGRSIGRRRARAPNARIIHSTGGAVRVARDSRRCAEVWLFAFETTPLAAFASLDSVAVISQQCRVKIHVSFPSQAATSTSP